MFFAKRQTCNGIISQLLSLLIFVSFEAHEKTEMFIKKKKKVEKVFLIRTASTISAGGILIISFKPIIRFFPKDNIYFP